MSSEEIKNTRLKMEGDAVISQIELFIAGADLDSMDTNGFIRYLKQHYAIGKENAITARKLSKLLTGTEGKEKHVRAVAQKAYMDTAGTSAEYFVCTIGGRGIFLSKDPADTAGWFYTNFKSAITLLNKCKLFPVLLAEHRNEILSLIK